MKVRIPAEARDFYFLHDVQTGSGAHPAFYSSIQWVPGWGVFPMVKATGAEVKKGRSYTCTPPLRLHGAENFTFTSLLTLARDAVSG
jgi:hypothetical protein